MKKQTQSFIIKIWCSCIVLAPLLFVFFMCGTLIGRRNPWAEMAFDVAITMALGLICFLPALLIALIVTYGVVKAETKPATAKLISLICLVIPVALASGFLYKNNLSIIYKGTGVMVFCYLGLFITLPWVYKLESNVK